MRCESYTKLGGSNLGGVEVVGRSTNQILGGLIWGGFGKGIRDIQICGEQSWGAKQIWGVKNFFKNRIFLRIEQIFEKLQKMRKN